MKTYQLKEPNVQAGIITAVNTVYTLDDGSTQTLPAADQSAVGSYLIVPGDIVDPAADFNSKYVEVTAPLS